MTIYSKVIGLQSLQSKIIRIAWSLSAKTALLEGGPGSIPTLGELLKLVTLHSFNPDQTGGGCPTPPWGILPLLPGGSCQVSQNFWISSLKLFLWTQGISFWNCFWKVWEIWCWNKLVSLNFAKKRGKFDFFFSFFNVTCKPYFFFMNLNSTWKMHSFEVHNMFVAKKLKGAVHIGPRLRDLWC